MLSCVILFSTCFLAFITATYLVEAVSIANTIETSMERKKSVFAEECYKTPQLQRKSNDEDAGHKESPYYIR